MCSNGPLIRCGVLTSSCQLRLSSSISWRPSVCGSGYSCLWRWRLCGASLAPPKAHHCKTKVILFVSFCVPICWCPSWLYNRRAWINLYNDLPITKCLINKVRSYQCKCHEVHRCPLYNHITKEHYSSVTMPDACCVPFSSKKNVKP